MSAHTPGPWELLDKTRVSVTLPPTISGIGYSSHCVALVTGSDKRLNWDANARLIAAAPELLEALHNLLEAVESMQCTYGCVRGDTPEDSDTFMHEEWAEKFLQERANDAVAVLAKATGSAA